QAEVLSLLQAANSLFERAFGPEDPRSSQTLVNIASIQSQVGETRNAIETLQRAIAAAEKGLGPNHPLVGEAAARQARLLRKLGRKPEAANLDARARAIARETADNNLSRFYVDAHDVQVSTRRTYGLQYN